MRILHLLSQIEVTGAEVYAVQLAACQLNDEHRVWIMSDTLHSKTEATYIPVRLHVRTLRQRCKNISMVRRFVKQYKIDIVHAHSRAAIWVAHFALCKTKVPLISTIHGRQKTSLSKRLWDMYGDRVIAICQNVKRQIESELKILPQKIRIIPNGINFPQLSTKQKLDKNILTVAGRTTGPKGEILARLLQNVFPNLLVKYPDLHIQLIGGDLRHLSKVAQQQFYSLKKTYKKRLTHDGFVEGLSVYLAKSDCVIAAGRIAIEALALGVPVIALGEALMLGLIDADNLEAAMASNFGDIATRYDEHDIDLSGIVPQLDKVLSGFELPTMVSRRVRQRYDIKHVNCEIMQLYRSAILQKWHPRHIPILMYHKVLPQAENSRHKTFVTCEQFAQHMRFLAKHHFTPITFKDYFAFHDGQYPLSEFPSKPIIITFDDGYVNNLQYALPIMQHHHFIGVLFALGNGTIDYNRWDADAGEPSHQLVNATQLQQFSELGFEIGAHSLTHPHLTQLTDEQAYTEIIESKQYLEALLKQPVISFAYPYGDYNTRTKALVRKAGFQCAVATDTGGLKLADDHFAIFRVNMMPRDHFLQFLKKTSHWYRKRYWHKRGK